MKNNPLGSVARDVTLGVNSRSNTKALLMCLSSVLMAPLVPQYIHLRLEGEFPAFSEYYLEQLFDLARMRDVEISLHVFRSQGVRKARQWQIDNCATDFLWSVDDDCIYQHACLAELRRVYFKMTTGCAYVTGCKVDVNNRRGYPNFNTKINPPEKLKDGCSFNHLYEPCETIPLVEVHTLDTGNVLLNVKLLRNSQVTFDPFGVSTNSGGEDTLFALLCAKYGFRGFFAPRAIAVHLEKPGESFGEFAARGEMLLRACDSLKIPPDTIEHFKKEFMPFLELAEKVQ